MTILDIDSLLIEIPGDAPCGPDLEYDRLLVALKEAAEGRPERQMGESIIPGKDPDWPVVKRQAIELYTRTKDIRVTIYLIRALLALDHLSGFGIGISLMRQLLERYWDAVHPQLDSEDDDDPTMRLSNLKELTDLSLLNAIRVSPLAKAVGVGSCSMRDLAIASGDVIVSADSTVDPPTLAAINAVFASCKQDELRTTIESVKRTIEDVVAIERFVNQKVGAAHTFSLEELSYVLKQADRILQEYAPTPVEQSGTALQSNDPHEVPNLEGGQSMKNNPYGGSTMLGEIRSREDVILALDKVCEYYRRYEPSSPVPLLIQRSRRLVSMNFLDIIRDLAPAGVSEIEAISGGKEKDSK